MLKEMEGEGVEGQVMEGWLLCMEGVRTPFDRHREKTLKARAGHF